MNRETSHHVAHPGGKSDAARIGVVLSSGGGRGVYAHTGFLLALERMGIDIRASAGCSAGAVVGGVAASGTDLQRWAHTITQVARREFWTPDSLPRFLWHMSVRRGRGYTGLSSTDTAIDFCRRNLAVQSFSECRYPFYAVAVDLGRGRKVVFASGELASRMMASAAMPVLYRPVKIDGEYYCDGALIELAPTGCGDHPPCFTAAQRARQPRSRLASPLGHGRNSGSPALSPASVVSVRRALDVQVLPGRLRGRGRGHRA